MKTISYHGPEVAGDRTDVTDTILLLKYIEKRKQNGYCLEKVFNENRDQALVRECWRNWMSTLRQSTNYEWVVRTNFFLNKSFIKKFLNNLFWNFKSIFLLIFINLYP